ncbi:FAD-dependent thymidylate synthase [Chloroflexota bacterium]
MEMIDGYNVEVRLLAHTGLTEHLGSRPAGEDPLQPCEEIIEYSGRLCWDSTEKLGTTPRRIQKWIDVGHESVIEHASATFYIRASRVLTHELVRHRIASYSQRSQRYVRETDPRYIVPPDFSEGSEARAVFKKAMESAWSAYGELLRLGHEAEIARYVLPNACESQIVVTMNFRELRHLIKLRTSKRALPEMRAVAGEIRRIMKERAPRVFEDI